jgi:GT2 family glycosyltransferase
MGADKIAGASIDVVVVSGDMDQMTLTCVAGLADPLVASVVVVDNAFEPGTGACREQIAELAHVVRLDEPHGFGAANNVGIAAGAAEYVLLLNSDIVVTEGAIATLAQALADEGAVAAGGRLVDPETLETQEGYRPRSFPTALELAVVLTGIEERWPGNPISRRYHGWALDDHKVQAVQQPAAAALMVRRAALEAVGGFDERFWFWFEDSDLLLRLSGLGTVLYVPGAAFKHLGGGSFKAWSKEQRIRSIHHGIVHYADAHFGWAQRALVGGLAVAVSAPRIACFARSSNSQRNAQAQAWREVARAGAALALGRPLPAIAGPGTGRRA